MRPLIILLFIHQSLISQAHPEGDGYAVIRNDTIYGDIQINFAAGSILIRQDSINRLFLSDIEVITFLNKTRDTFVTFRNDERTEFYKVIVAGEFPLLEKNDRLFTARMESTPAPIEEKVLFDLFGKKEVRDYAFVRNINLNDRHGLIDLFRYFNKYIDI